MLVGTIIRAFRTSDDSGVVAYKQRAEVNHIDQICPFVDPSIYLSPFSLYFAGHGRVARPACP